jgi:hypothetical protein
MLIFQIVQIWIQWGYRRTLAGVSADVVDIKQDQAGLLDTGIDTAKEVNVIASVLGLLAARAGRSQDEGKISDTGGHLIIPIRRAP